MTEDKKLLVSAIKNGTVLDHIDAGNALKIIHLLNLAQHKQVVTVGLNLPSQAMGNKDLIKIENLELSPEQINNIAILAPNATINIINDYKVVKKLKAELPKIIHHVVTCPNPKCITNNERVETKFHISKEDKVHHKGIHKINCEARQGELLSKRESPGGQGPLGQKDVLLKCNYCEKEFTKDEIIEYKNN